MGFFKIDRDLLSHYLWKDTPFSKGQAWIDLIGMACYKDTTDMYNGQIIHCKRGNVYKTFSYLSRRWGWSRKKVTSFIRALERDEMVATKVTTHGTTITIVNYDKFQGQGTTNGTTDGTTEEQQKNSRGYKDLRSIRSIEKDKEIKEDGFAPIEDEEGEPWPEGFFDGEDD